MRTTVLALLMSSTLLVSACANDPVSIGSPMTVTEAFPGYGGRNGFALNGNGRTGATFSADSITSRIIDGSPLIRTFVTQSGTFDGVPAEVSVAIAHPIVIGGFNWSDEFADSSRIVSVVITTGGSSGRRYVSISGATTITRFGAVGDTIEGTYRGTMKAAGTPLSVKVTGAFAVKRKE